MLESDFEIDPSKLTDGSRRFPADRLTRPTGAGDGDVSYLAESPETEFGRHVWDEGGHS